MRTVLERWESRGSKYWAELYRDEWGFGYSALDAGGSFGPMPESAAREAFRNRLPDLQADANKSPMRRVS